MRWQYSQHNFLVEDTQSNENRNDDQNSENEVQQHEKDVRVEECIQIIALIRIDTSLIVIAVRSRDGPPHQ